MTAPPLSFVLVTRVFLPCEVVADSSTTRVGVFLSLSFLFQGSGDARRGTGTPPSAFTLTSDPVAGSLFDGLPARYALQSDDCSVEHPPPESTFSLGGIDDLASEIDRFRGYRIERDSQERSLSFPRPKDMIFTPK
jgi:hypothetical protein